MDADIVTPVVCSALTVVVVTANIATPAIKRLPLTTTTAEDLAVLAAVAAMVVEAKATITAHKMALAVVPVLAVPAVELTLEMAVLAGPAGPVEMEQDTAVLAGTEIQEPRAILAGTATTRAVAVVPVALAALAEAQPGNTSAVYPTSHSRTMEPF